MDAERLVFGQRGGENMPHSPAWLTDMFVKSGPRRMAVCPVGNTVHVRVHAMAAEKRSSALIR